MGQRGFWIMVAEVSKIFGTALRRARKENKPADGPARHLQEKTSRALAA